MKMVLYPPFGVLVVVRQCELFLVVLVKWLWCVDSAVLCLCYLIPLWLVVLFNRVADVARVVMMFLNLVLSDPIVVGTGFYCRFDYFVIFSSQSESFIGAEFFFFLFFFSSGRCSLCLVFRLMLLPLLLVRPSSQHD